MGVYLVAYPHTATGPIGAKPSNAEGSTFDLLNLSDSSTMIFNRN